MTKLTHENNMKRQQRDKIVESNRIWSIEVLTKKKKKKRKKKEVLKYYWSPVILKY